MSITITSPITGAAQTGLTSPTYTVVNDTAPPQNPGKQVAVTALGGTQTGVNTHSVAAPFTLNITRPATLKTLGQPNPVTGVINQVPMNVYKFIGRHGVLPLAGQPYKTAICTVTVEIPAGADAADPANIRALLSATFGLVAQQSSGFGDMTINGVL